MTSAAFVPQLKCLAWHSRQVSSSISSYWNFSYISAQWEIILFKLARVGTVSVYSTLRDLKKVKVHGKTFTCKVTVKKPEVIKVWINSPNISLNLYEWYTIRYASNPSIIPEYYDSVWKSGNETVVQVEDSYEEYADIYAVEIGETDISMIVGGKKVQCHVVVK